MLIRSGLRSTKWGSSLESLGNTNLKPRDLIAAGTITGMATFTGYNAATSGQLIELLPLIPVTFGTLADRLSIGRQKRPLSLCASLSAGTYALMSANPLLVANEILGAKITHDAIKHHDRDNAAGTNASPKENKLAHYHGIKRGIATGATIAGQVDFDADIKALPKEQQKKILAERYMALPEDPKIYKRDYNNLPKFGERGLD